MKIAVLGWGSLIWDPRDLPLSGDWKRGGPVLPIEFSRASGDGRLTLVVDEESGTAVPTQYAVSGDVDIRSARESLRKREDTVLKWIAAVDAVNDIQAAVHSRTIGDLIAQWSRRNGFDGVVWTGLPPNFLERLNVSFSWEAAFTHLDGLSDDKKGKAFEYLQKAPEEVQTAFRREFQKRYPRGVGS